jgi:NADH:ubiquinone oxidoreductase subunit B-like Fe-S oxidoreductase
MVYDTQPRLVAIYGTQPRLSFTNCQHAVVYGQLYARILSILALVFAQVLEEKYLVSTGDTEQYIQTHTNGIVASTG